MPAKSTALLVVTLLAAYATRLPATEPGTNPPPQRPQSQIPRACAEPTEAEMRQALQNYLDDLNARMKPPPTLSLQVPEGRHSASANFLSPLPAGERANWAESAQGAATPRLELVSFKKIRCTPIRDLPGWMGEYIAEVRLHGSHPEAEEIAKSSGQPTRALFLRGHNGWIWGPAK